MRCRTTDAAVVGMLRAGHAAPSPETPPDLEVLHLLPGDLPHGLWPRWGETYFREREVEAALQDTRYRFHFYDDLGFWQIHDRAKGRGLQLAAAPSALPPWEAGSPLRNFIHWALLEQGGGLVHAGTLASGGSGVLLAGKGGSGKSGTVLAGVRHGLDSVGDDYVALTGDGPLRARAAFACMKIDPAGASRAALPEALTRGEALNWQGKYLLPLTRIAGHPMPAEIRLGALVLPRITHAARTSFHPIGAREAFLALAPSGVTQIPCARPEMARTCAAVSRGLPGYRMDLGTDPHEIASALRTFIGELET
ncbi:MAG: serine kinase [Rhodobacteraceae bacterium]|nr:serine kinase [Paracoccaceae bacterium]MBR9823243.1 serine kinase [Paracoccaceae bacterium]